MSWSLDHNLDAGGPCALAQLAQLDHLGGLGGVVGIVEAARAAGIAKRNRHVVLVADFEQLVKVLVEGVFVAGDLHPAKQQRAAAADDVHEAAGLLKGLDDRLVDAAVDGHKVHAVLGVRAHDFEQVVLGELDQRLFHVADGVVHGDGAHHERRLVDELLAELACLARVGEVHDGVGAKVLGDLDLLPFLGGIGLVARDAQVHVDLGGQAFADAKGAHALFDVHDVGGNGDAAVGHALADVLGVAMLALGDFLHLRCDLPGAGEVDLRDELGLGLCAHWHGSLRWHYPYQVCGSGRARPISACRPVLQAPRYVMGSSIA